MSVVTRPQIVATHAGYRVLDVAADSKYRFYLVIDDSSVMGEWVTLIGK